MKKLIAISVVFALAAGAVFAADLGVEVIGTVNLLEGESGGDGVTSSAGMNRIRLSGEGANDDGTFGAWFRADGAGDVGFAGHAWWKPIDQLKIWIGSNGGDGFFAKEGVTGWMFYQRLNDTGVGDGNNNTWGWGRAQSLHTRDAFYGGGYDGVNAFYATISPAEIVNINLEIPFFNDAGSIPTKDAFKAIIAQLDFNLSFGNIALTYEGDPSGGGGKGPSINPNKGKIFAYAGISAIEKVALDIGIGFSIPDEVKSPIAAGVGAKVDISDAFALKARVAASFGGDAKALNLLADILPWITFSDNLRLLPSLGLGLSKPDGGDASLGFHFQPVIWVGQEWGPSFWAGFRLDAEKPAGGGDVGISWAVPIAIGVSF